YLFYVNIFKERFLSRFPFKAKADAKVESFWQTTKSFLKKYQALTTFLTIINLSQEYFHIPHYYI
ncbi:hypothetical protein, partial [Prevotella illustrans]|uniref:hypothetical protein n=1 Tax=Prevotella illustrans TaxID=2800387 RepID=UPI001A9E19AC